MHIESSLFKDAPDLGHVSFSQGMMMSDFIDAIGQTSLEARNVCRGARLFKNMITDSDALWLGIAGGMGAWSPHCLKRGSLM